MDHFRSSHHTFSFTQNTNQQNQYKKLHFIMIMIQINTIKIMIITIRFLFSYFFLSIDRRWRDGCDLSWAIFLVDNKNNKNLLN